MSRVVDQSVPPSLLADYQRLFRTGKLQSDASQLVRTSQTVRAARPEADADPNSFAASDAARWLTDRWRGTATPANQAAFYAARKAEILAGNYPSTYWWTPAPSADRTEYCIPTQQEILTPDNSSINPLYWDETRQPRRCFYLNVDHRYATPNPPGTQQNPAPGWKGQVSNGIWQDTWHAQQLRDYNLAIQITNLDERPILLDLTAAISAIASTRGHRNWFSIAIQVYNRPPWELEGAVFLYADTDRYDLAIPPADPNGWSHSLTRRLIRRARDYFPRLNYGENKISVRTATTPARGYYFARNDLVEVSHRIALTVAIAKTP